MAQQCWVSLYFGPPAIFGNTQWGSGENKLSHLQYMTSVMVTIIPNVQNFKIKWNTL